MVGVCTALEHNTICIKIVYVYCALQKKRPRLFSVVFSDPPPPPPYIVSCTFSQKETLREEKGNEGPVIAGGWMGC
jgi:hypothetical protein